MDADAFATAIDDTCIIATSILLKIKEAFPDNPPKVWMMTRGSCLRSNRGYPSALSEYRPLGGADSSSRVLPKSDIQCRSLAGYGSRGRRRHLGETCRTSFCCLRTNSPSDQQMTEKLRFWYVVSQNRLASNMKSTSVPWKLPLDGDAIRVIEAQEEINSDFHRPEVDINVEAFSVVAVDGASKAVVCGIVGRCPPRGYSS